RRDRLDGGENGDLRRAEAKSRKEIDGVLNDVALGLEIRRDVYCRIGDEQGLRMAGNVHDEHVADAPSRPQAGLALHYLRQHLVGVQASLHQELGFPGANELDSLFGRGVAMRHVDDVHAAEIERELLRYSLDFLDGTDKNRLDQSRLACLQGALERGLVARMRHGGGNGLELLCCGDEAIVLFVAPRRGRGCVLLRGSVLLYPPNAGQVKL